MAAEPIGELLQPAHHARGVIGDPERNQIDADVRARLALQTQAPADLDEEPTSLQTARGDGAPVYQIRHERSRVAYVADVTGEMTDPERVGPVAGPGGGWPGGPNRIPWAGGSSDAPLWSLSPCSSQVGRPEAAWEAPPTPEKARRERERRLSERPTKAPGSRRRTSPSRRTAASARADRSLRAPRPAGQRRHPAARNATRSMPTYEPASRCSRRRRPTSTKNPRRCRRPGGTVLLSIKSGMRCRVSLMSQGK